MSKRIQLKLMPNGVVEADVMGFDGDKCIDYISILEELIDAQATDSSYQKEFEANNLSLSVSSKTKISNHTNGDN